MKKDYLRLKAMLVAGALAVSGATLTGCGEKYDGNERVFQESTQEYGADLLDVGKHIISVPIKDPVYNIMQYNYHPGYKVVGITSSSLLYTFNGACLVYVNEYPVECNCTDVDKNGNRIYGKFGKPIGYERKETDKNEFNPGEHIISVPIDDAPYYGITQFEYHEGYEVVGMASSSSGYFFDGGCVLYVNTVPVKCTLTKVEDGKELYLSFGTPMEETKTLH